LGLPPTCSGRALGQLQASGDSLQGIRLHQRNDPIFTHQYSQAWYDFRGKRDAYADYFENSVTATRAHKAFCLSYPKWYSEDYWGVTASDYERGYTAWGGPPAQGPLDGTVVPSAAAGSLAFLPADCLSVLRDLRAKWGKRAWGRYGFVDAFHPAANWYDSDVLGIDQGISVLMAENLRSEWCGARSCATRQTWMRSSALDSMARGSINEWNPERLRASSEHRIQIFRTCGSGRRYDGSILVTKAPSKPITLKELAATLAALSVHGLPHCQWRGVRASHRKETEERVLHAAALYSYSANTVARSLRQKRTFTIGVIVPEISEGYSTAVLSGIEDELLKDGYFYFVVSHRHRADLLEGYPRMMLARSVEGIIAVDTQLEEEIHVPVYRFQGIFAGRESSTSNWTTGWRAACALASQDSGTQTDRHHQGAGVQFRYQPALGSDSRGSEEP